MSRFVNQDMVSIQVESSRENVWVHDGLAVEPRRYYPDGLALTDQMIFPDDLHERVAVTSPIVGVSGQPSEASTIPKVVTRVSGGNTSTTITYTDTQIGPVVAQTKAPIVVVPGERVAMSGQFSIRRTGLNQLDGGEDTADTTFGVNVRVSIWGIGTHTDDYGVSTDVRQEILSYEAVLQVLRWGTHPGNGQVVFTIPPTTPAVVPPDVNRVHLAIMFVDNDTAIGFPSNVPHNRELVGFVTTQYVNHKVGSTPPFNGLKDNNMITLSTDNPIRLHTIPPVAVHPITEHPLSSTGVAFVSRKHFDNVRPGCQVTALASPTGNPSTVEVWERTTSDGRGALLTTIEVPAGGRITVTVDPTTDRLELHAPGAFWIESVLAPHEETLAIEQNRTTKVTYDDVTADLVRATSEPAEADLGILSLRFISPTLSTKFAPGKRVRLLGKWPGGFGAVFTGTVRGRRIVPDLGRGEQLEVAVHDCFGRLGTGYSSAFDNLVEYGRALHPLGTGVILDGVEYSGPARPLPTGIDAFPSYVDENMDLLKSLLMARNTRKAFLYVDRHDQVVFAQTLRAPVLDVSDIPGEGDMSYSTNIEFESDTKSILSTVAVTEHSIDTEDFNARNYKSGDEPPVLTNLLVGQNAKIEFLNQPMIDLIGNSRVSFDVVRGTGLLPDLVANNKGPGFTDWAAQILADYSSDVASIRSIRLIVNSDTIRKIAQLEILDAVVVRHKGAGFVCRIRSMKHEITSTGRWLVELNFTPKADQNYWLPNTPVPLITLGDTDAGTLTAASTGLVDGGHPTDTETYVLDGGTL